MTSSIKATPESSWLPTLPGLKSSLQSVARNTNTIALVVIGCVLLNQVQGADAFGDMGKYGSMGECIHVCKETLFGGTNTWWTNTVCGGKCAIFDWGIMINEGVPLGARPPGAH